MTDEAADETTPAPAGNLLPQLIGDEMRTSYINYAMSVIVGRALPDVRDGLKPVHRRVLFGMHEAGHSSERSYTKSARSVGEVMGKYHPHGDQSIYDTMVRMAQDFSLRYPLIDGQGNFGSIDGDPPAAMRYTESRLDRISKHMLEDIDKNTVDFQPNFDDSENEPSVLPARLPNLLLNGSDGIAVGMATKIPPHNLNEVTAAINMHVERILEGGEDKGDPERAPAITVKEYMAHLQGPDFPTGATVYGIDGITEMYEGGHGKFHIRSTCEVLDDDEGKRIIVTEIPYQVKKAAMLEGIAELVSKETVKGIRDLRDESSKEGIRVVIEIKQNADPHAVLNQLFKSSRLQESYSANMMGIIDSRPVELSLSIILHTYVRHRESVIERRTQYELDKAQARAHVLEGLVIAQQRIEDIIKVSRGSAGRENFEKVLRGEEKFKGVKKFSFSEPQSKAIAERRLYQLSRLDVKKVEDEFDQLSEAIEDFESILASRRKRLELLMDELRQMTEKHGDERRTHIDPKPLSMDREDLIEERAIVITLSEDNYIRHLPVDAFRLQNKGGKGLKGITTKDEDFPKCIITCFSKDRLLFFTDQGRVYGLKAWETPQASRQSRGSHFRNLLPDFREDERIVTILTISKDLVTPTEEVPEPWRDQFLMFATERGRIKKSELKHYAKINKNGKLGIKLADGDMLVSVRSAIDDDDVVMISNTGRACRFRPNELKPRRNTETGEIEHYLTVRPQGRVTRGVAGMSLNDDEDVVGLIVTSNQDTHVVTISKNGFAKRTRLGSGDMRERRDANDEIIYAEDGLPETERDGYRKTNRASKGVKTMNLKDGDQIVRCHQMDDLQDQLFILSAKGMMIRIIAAQARHTAGRATLGGRVMNLRDVNKKYIDEVIFSARLPADLVDEDDIPAHLQELGEEE